jgi:4-hydroxy-tetrahydrodipicolinate reductase
MKTIGVVGLGKMGQTIVSLLETDPTLICHTFQRITKENQALLMKCQVIIEFTIADAAPDVIRFCLEHSIPVVSGTTGWHESHLESVLTFCRQHKGTFLYATNFSIGMNVMFALNRKLASVMNHLPQFKPSIKEIHHVHKKDSPSGTAYTLIEDILSRHKGYSDFQLNEQSQSSLTHQLPVTSVREGEVKGFHQVTWHSEGEEITISHEALDRKIFAQGAVMAAIWLVDQVPGIYTMQDIIHFE